MWTSTLRSPGILALALLFSLFHPAQPQTNEWSNIQDHCGAADVTPPSNVEPRPDPANEGVLYNEEVITGLTCFFLHVTTHRRYNSVHVTVMKREQFDICKSFSVKSVEIMGFAYRKYLRDQRVPFGFLYREGNVTTLSSETCGEGGANFTGPVDNIHPDYVKVPISTKEWQDCIRPKDGYIPGSDPSTSIRIAAQLPDHLTSTSTLKEKAVACAIWSYIGKNYTYPPAVITPGKTEFRLEFLAELDVVGPGNQMLFRSVSKLAEKRVMKLVPKLICTVEVPPPPPPPTPPTTTTTSTTCATSTSSSSTTTPSSTSSSSSSTSSSSSSSSSTSSTTASSTSSSSTSSTTMDPCLLTTTTTTTTTTTPPPPVYIDVPCPPHDTCKAVEPFIDEPERDRFSSVYISSSDACKCREEDMQTNYTLRKYPYGGFNFGMQPSVPSPPHTPPGTPAIIPAIPVSDVLFGDCLQFYFDTVTACAIFLLGECKAPQPVTRLELVEFFIFALGSTQPTESEAVPFGTWEAIEDSLGNCGDLVNFKNKYKKDLTQLWTRTYGEDYCAPNPLGWNEVEMGMPQGEKPEVWRVTLPRPLVLQSTTAKPFDLVYAVRLNNKDFSRASVAKRPQFINFVLEAYTKIETTYEPLAKTQIISLKTPIVKTNYHLVSGTELRLDISTNVSTTHPKPYFQLLQSWNDPLHPWGSTAKCNKYFTLKPAPTHPLPPSDNGIENTCRCYSPLRHTAFKPNNPMPLATFLQKVASGPIPITEKCFTFGFLHNNPGSISGGACTGDPDDQRVMLYFGLTCTGPNGLEVVDMVVQAQNHGTYPIGFWKHFTLAEQGNECKSTLSSATSTGGSSWQIRELIPVSTYDCPSIYKRPNEETFLHSEPAHLLFFNNNLTQEAKDSSQNFGFCSWWYYKHKYDHVTNDNRNFYFDFQFVATAYIEHRPSNTQYLVTFRSDRAGFNVKSCQSEPLSRNLRSWDIYMNKNYYDTQVNEKITPCLVPLSRIDTFQTGLCGCYIGKTPTGQLPNKSIEDTHRFNASEYPDDNDPVHIVAGILRSCINIHAVPDHTPEPFSLVVSFRMENNVECQKFKLFELALQALNNYGLPMGSWETKLITGGRLCTTASLQGEGSIETFKCPFSPPLKDYYKTDVTNIDILHFKNRWMDDHYRGFCARWRYPKEYAAKAGPGDLPVDFQFYAQTNFLHMPSNMMVTGPTFAFKKIKFDPKGNFSEEIEILPFQHIRDFNNYLHSQFQKGNHCIISYPKPPDYQSFSCKIFHPEPRVDLYDQSPDNFAGLKVMNCFSFTAYPGNEPLSMHLRFRQTLGKPDCPVAIHFAVTAYNELGFPIGKTTEDSVQHYDHPFVIPPDPRLCSNEEDDAEVLLDSIYAKDNGECPFYSNPATGLEETNSSLFYGQQVSKGNYPHFLAIGINPGNPTRGICFHWKYEEQPAGQRTPEYVQFYLELFVPLSKENTIVGTAYLMKSQKFKMNYVAGSSLAPPPNPPKPCHDDADIHGLFTPVPFPTDPWERLHNYTIYPDKNSYRRCLQDSNNYKECQVKFTVDDKYLPISPIVVIPGIIGPDRERYNHRYNSTHAIYNGCVSAKLCFAPIPNKDNTDCLLEMNCEFMWAIGKQPINPVDELLPDPDENDEIVLELYAATVGWAAIGLSFDRNMGEDIVFECVKEQDGSVRMYHSWNVLLSITEAQRRHDNKRYLLPESVGNIGRMVHYTRDNDSMHCIFYIQTSFQARSLKTKVIYNYDLKSDRFCVLSAYGDKFKDPRSSGIASHTRGKRQGFATCKEVTDLSTRIMPSRTQVEYLQIHGAILTIAFFIFLSTGVFVPRYMRHSLVKIVWKYPLWLWIHAIFCTSGVILLIIGFFLNIFGTAGWTSPLSSPFHNWMGYMSMFFVVINFPVGCHIRNEIVKPEADVHSIFYILHGAGGHFGLVAGLFLIFLSVHVEYSFMPCLTQYVAGSYVLFYFIVHIVMSYNRLWLNKLVASPEEKREAKPFRVTPFALITQSAPFGTLWYQEFPKATTVRLVLLLIYFIISCAFTIAVCYFVLSSNHSCALEKSHTLTI